MSANMGIFCARQEGKSFCERDEAESGKRRPRDSVSGPRHRIPRNKGRGWGERGCLAKDCNLIFLGIKSSVIHKHKIHSVIRTIQWHHLGEKDHFVPILAKTRNKGWLGFHPNNQIVIIRGKTYMTGAKPGVRSWQSFAAPAMSSSPRPSGCGTAPDSEDGEGFGLLVI